MNIQLRRAIAANAFSSTAVLFLRVTAYFVGIICLLLLIVSLFVPFSGPFSGMLILLIVPAIIFAVPHFYFRYLTLFPLFGLTKTDLNIAENRLDFSAALFVNAIKSGNSDKAWKEISKNYLAIELLLRLGITSSVGFINPEQLKTILSELSESKEGVISTIDIISSWLTTDPDKVISSQRIPIEELVGLTQLYQQRQVQTLQRKQGWLRGDYSQSRGVANDWAASFTPILDNFSIEIPETIKYHTDRSKLFNREKIVDSAIASLNKGAGHNLLFIGNEGSGRKEIFYHIASKILTKETKTPIDGMSVRMLDVRRIFSMTKSNEELESLMSQLFAEISRYGKLLLYIDQLDIALEPDQKVGSYDLSSLISGLLEYDKVHIIASVTPETYTTIVKPNQAMSSQWTTVDIPKPDKKELPLILISEINTIESRYRCIFLYRAVKSIVDLGERYLPSEISPSREIAIAEEVASSAKGKQVITEELVVSVIENRSGVPIAVGQKDREKISSLPTQLKQRIIGQTEAITKVSNALTRARAGLQGNSTKPIGSFLFMGPTGVGKTETAKALADIYFGSREKLVRLDMTEFATENGLTKLLGTHQVNQPGSLSILIEQNPSAVVLLDEFEKSHELVKNAFLQVLDEGRLTTNFGKVLSFTNTIIIATSNAGSSYISEQVSKSVPIKEFEKSLIDNLTTTQVFSPELLNRFDDVVVFEPLNPEQVSQIVQLRLSELSDRLKKEKGISLTVSDRVVKELSSLGYDPVFGARALERVIKDKLETVIAEQLLANNPSPGTTLAIDHL